MANNLKRKIEEGEIVALKKNLFKKEYQDLSNRLFECLGGFGMSDITMGSAIYGKFLDTNEECRYEGYDIDKDETKKFQEMLNSLPTRVDWDKVNPVIQPDELKLYNQNIDGF